MRRVFGSVIAGVALCFTLIPLAAEASTAVVVKEQVSSTVSTSLPLLRISSTAKLTAAHLPTLNTNPRLKISWQQIAPNRVQAVVTGKIVPGTNYLVDIPKSVQCATTCSFSGTKRVSLTSSVDYSWEAQLLATLRYLPVSFTPDSPQSDPAAQTSGTFNWLFPAIASSLEPLWSPSTNNVILKGALMDFQSVAKLPTTGIVDTATWNALVAAVSTDQVDPSTYNYVNVTETYPETLHLYLGGKLFFTTLINTGIPQAPTSLGTYPVYLRLTSQTMSGTNPDGSHYSDPGIPWISYFNGGDALHGYIRYHYGFPQSLGCVEMQFSDAKTVWPHTPIGTLVTIAP